MDVAIQLAADAVELILAEGAEAAQRRFNARAVTGAEPRRDRVTPGRRRRSRPASSVDAAGEADVVEQRAVVGDEQHRAAERVERRLELLDRRQVEVVGRLVEHEAVGAVRHQQREHGAGPLAR